MPSRFALPCDDYTVYSGEWVVGGIHETSDGPENFRGLWSMTVNGPMTRASRVATMNRSCQRQTQVFDLPVRRMISLLPTPSALERMIAARQACFCEALRSLVIASSRPRTDRVIVMEMPVRMRQTRTATEIEESQSRLLSGKGH
jgi:hypothetical protein